MVSKTEKTSNRQSDRSIKHEKKSALTNPPSGAAGTVNSKKQTPPIHQRKSLVVSKTAGGKISEYPIVFTKDSRYVFACTGSSIKIYSVATGAALKVLSKTGSIGGHTKAVTNVALNPKNAMQLYSSSLDGSLKLWDYNDDVLLKTLHVGQPVEQMVICPNDPEYAYLLTSNNSHRATIDKEYTIYRYYIGSDEMLPGKRRRVILRTTHCHAIDVSLDGKYVAIGSQRFVNIWPVTEGEGEVPPSQLYKWSIPNSRKLKFSPTKPSLAVGNVVGEILLCYFSPDDLANPKISSNHWHSSEVRALQFMADGIYAISGGSECVLVFWQLETGYKQFMPRLGGEINSISISPDHKYYCVGLDDNSIRLINAITQKIDQVIQGLQYGDDTAPLTGLVVEPRNRSVVLNGVTGNVQFYNCASDAHVSENEVVPVSRLQSVERLTRANVQHVAFLSNGEWMATVDIRDDLVNTPEQHLKFWRWDPDTQSYVLHTRVVKPHAGKITSLTFNPASTRGRPMAITTSKDKTFKVWHFTSDLGRAYDKDEEAWTCRSIGLYRRDIPEAASFSSDGSILAVAFGPLVTLWDPYENCIRQVLAQPSEENIHTLQFVGDSPYLLTASKHRVTVWNMLTCSVWWSYKIKSSYVAVDTVSPRIAIVCNNEKHHASLLAVFDAKSATPLALRHAPSICNAITFVPRSGKDAIKQRSDLVVLTDSLALDVISIVDPSSAATAKPSSEKDTKATSLHEGVPAEKTLLNDIFGKRTQERANKAEEEKLRTQTAAKLREQAMQKESTVEARTSDGDHSDILGAPSHALPSVEAVFETFMGSLMQLRISEDAAPADNMDVDETESIEQSTPHHQPHEHQSESFTLEELPSLNAYFADLVKPRANGVAKAHHQDLPSSDTDVSDEEDEDPSEIDW
ncbi:WD40-repeat-containing domain protein [Fennellomyces sp. T-0311]|nr:WD40-repeat-containing domain protein [Fennellomyces sp. T-0311]